MISKKATTQEQINTLIASRWSGRAYDPARKINRKQIISMLEAARWAPSCYGDEPWRYVVCNRHDDEEAWHRALGCLVEGNQQWAQHAPVLFLVFANTLFQHNGQENRWAAYDTGAASISICLQATELGLMAHQMGGILEEKIRTEFNVPEQFLPMSVMALGYQLDKDAIPQDMREKELAERKRRPLAELFYSGTWGKAYSADT